MEKLKLIEEIIISDDEDCKCILNSKTSKCTEIFEKSDHLPKFYIEDTNQDNEMEIIFIDNNIYNGINPSCKTKTLKPQNKTLCTTNTESLHLSTFSSVKSVAEQYLENLYNFNLLMNTCKQLESQEHLQHWTKNVNLRKDKEKQIPSITKFNIFHKARRMHERRKSSKINSKKKKHCLGSECIYLNNCKLPQLKNILQENLRPVIIDGNNVAFAHGQYKKFSAKGIQICAEYFCKRGHKTVIFLPFHRKNASEEDRKILNHLSYLQLLYYTPSRVIKGKRVSCYDDRFIVKYAVKTGGIIVTGDNYKDLYYENPEWQETIDNRILMFTFIDDIIMFPDDPLGRNGPSLTQFLCFK